MAALISMQCCRSRVSRAAPARFAASLRLPRRMTIWRTQAVTALSVSPPLSSFSCLCLSASAVEKDEAFARRMQPVFVEEPSVEETVSILRGIRDRYSAHHGVTILDAALVVAAKLAKRYIPTRRLPDSAIDLMDEACASVRVALDSSPEIIDQLQRRQLQLQVEATALEAEAGKDTSSKARLAKIEEELANVEEKLAPLLLQHEAEKSRVSELRSAQQRLDGLKAKVTQKEKERDFAAVADLKFGAIPELEKKIERLRAAAAAGAGAGAGAAGGAGGAPAAGGAGAASGGAGVSSGKKASGGAGAGGMAVDGAASDGTGATPAAALLTEVVGPEQIAEVVARWTGIPVNKLTATDRDRLLNLESHLHERVIGQDEAVREVANAVLRSRAGLGAPGRPSSFLFLGPTGVGKTELAKALAVELFDDEKAMVSQLRYMAFRPGFSGCRYVLHFGG